MDEDTSLEVGAVQKIFDLMFVEEYFKGTGIVMYVDKEFDITRLCNWEESLGILIFAITKGRRPNVMKLPVNN